MPTATSLPITCTATIVTASHCVGLTLPGMIDEPGSFSGIVISPIPQRGPEARWRTSFAIYRFHRRDAALTAVILLLGGGIYYGVFGGFAAYQYYPIVTVRQDTAALLTYGAYALLTALPSTIEAGEIIRWKYLQSKI